MITSLDLFQRDQSRPKRSLASLATAVNAFQLHSNSLLNSTPCGPQTLTLEPNVFFDYSVERQKRNTRDQSQPNHAHPSSSQPFHLYVSYPVPARHKGVLNLKIAMTLTWNHNNAASNPFTNNLTANQRRDAKARRQTVATEERKARIITNAEKQKACSVKI